MPEPEEWQKKAICEAMERRGWLVNSFAQIEYLLGDLIQRGRGYPEYAQHTKTIPSDSTNRVRKVRLILVKDGPLRRYGVELEPLLQQFEAMRELRHLLAHGFCAFHHTPAGEFGLHFRKFERLPDGGETILERTITPGVFEAEAARARELASKVLTLFIRMHRELGWSSPGGA